MPCPALRQYQCQIQNFSGLSERFCTVDANTLQISVEFELIEDRIVKNNTDIPKTGEKVACEGFWRPLSDNIVGAHLFGRGLYLVQTVVGYTFGIFVGLGVGWLLGGYIGSVHVQYTRHAVDFLDFNQVREWQDIPWSFARTGAMVGVLVGLVATRIMEFIFLNRTIISLCKEKGAEPADIASLLGRGVRQIRMRMNRLAAKGIIAYQITDSPARTSPDVSKQTNAPRRLAAPAPALERV